MFAYLIIAAEIAILYFVFWYLYIYEPRPRRILGNPWGRYQDGDLSTGRIDPTLPFIIEAAPPPDRAGERKFPAMSMLPSWLTGETAIGREFRRAAFDLREKGASALPAGRQRFRRARCLRMARRLSSSGQPAGLKAIQAVILRFLCSLARLNTRTLD